MTQNTFLKTAGIIFLIVALLHLWRAVSGIDLTLGDTLIPTWISWLGAVVLGFLAYQGLRNR